MRTSVGRPRWMSPSTPSTACRSSDARATSAPPDPRRGWGQCARTPDPCTTLAHAVRALLAATERDRAPLIPALFRAIVRGAAEPPPLAVAGPASASGAVRTLLRLAE